MTTSHLKQVLALGAAVLTLSVGGAFAATTTDNSVNVMSGPGSHFKTIATLPADDNVTVGHKSGSWCGITAPATGWVPCADINGTTKTSATAATPSTGWNGYDYQDDPNMGPNGLGSLHELYNGSFS